MKKHILIFSVFSLLSVALYAQEATPRVNGRQKAQRVRIAEGRADGDLTNREATALNQQQRHIRRTERRAKADGNVTVAERRKIERKQDRANRTIHRAKNNSIQPNN
ncbi:MAG TPA: hypothetical protein PLM56_14210 [Cyclobacteriaceae bacterium]|jgi:hypothetical protein|nr:hypothetical protein [Cyclobacteriaceae bacterium]HNT51491.1 hypothetical protein [Cyclobacteriaceae bacterium]HRE68067.1 hypothetical protein [Cyclobacteriaceae bacterium]HRF34656.1 hypothetical protein [Cyclobacteriaceae bacterium]